MLQMIKLYIKIAEEEMSAVFQDLSPPKAVKQILMFQKGKDTLCDIVGWSNIPTSSPTPAYAQRITDSGDAQAVLVHGGDAGVLLKPTDIHEPWNPQSPHQDHRPYLVISSEQDLRYVE
ncbi:MAG: hypothetical protein HYS07_04050 [Chlamydiae bacterium]|nr:hypothetical protein [Chlamydiota bacterium]